MLTAGSRTKRPSKGANASAQQLCVFSPLAPQRKLATEIPHRQSRASDGSNAPTNACGPRRRHHYTIGDAYPYICGAHPYIWQACLRPMHLQVWQCLCADVALPKLPRQSTCILEGCWSHSNASEACAEKWSRHEIRHVPHCKVEPLEAEQANKTRARTCVRYGTRQLSPPTVLRTALRLPTMPELLRLRGEGLSRTSTSAMATNTGLSLPYQETPSL